MVGVALELLAHPIGQLGRPVGQVVVGGDGGGDDLAAQPRLELGPRLGGIAAGDDLLARAHHHLEPDAQVVVDVGHQVLDAVGQHLLPRRGPALQRPGDAGLVGQAGHDGLGLLGTGDDLGLGLHDLGQLARGEGHLLGHPGRLGGPPSDTTRVRSHCTSAG